MTMPKTNEELLQESKNNWNRIPEAKRRECLDHLCEVLHPDFIRGMKRYTIGGLMELSFFHFMGGMMIRNILRGVMTDDQLPGVKYDNTDHEFRNWDDFYLGAIDELINEVPPANKP